MKYRIKNNQEKRLKFYVNQQEFEVIKTEFEASGYNSLSAYLRKKISGNGIIIPYPKELLNELDKMGIQQSRIGNNINQIAKKVIYITKKVVFQRISLTSSIRKWEPIWKQQMSFLRPIGALFASLVS